MNGSRPANLLPPKVLEPRWRQLSVPHRVLDVFVPEIGLQRPRVVPTVGQRIAASVPKHMAVTCVLCRPTMTLLTVF
jgi:hypothetical protein